MTKQQILNQIEALEEFKAKAERDVREAAARIQATQEKLRLGAFR